MTALRYRIPVLYCLRAHAAPYRIHFQRVAVFPESARHAPVFSRLEAPGSRRPNR